MSQSGAFYELQGWHKSYYNIVPQHAANQIVCHEMNTG